MIDRGDSSKIRDYYQIIRNYDNNMWGFTGNLMMADEQEKCDNNIFRHCHETNR